MELEYSIPISITLSIFIFLLIRKPSNNRNWSQDQAILPHAEISDNLVHVFNIRNFKYSSEFEYEKRFYNKVFDLNKIKKAYYIVVPFSSIRGIAHTLLSFEFEGDNF